MGRTNPFSKPLIYILSVIYVIVGFSTLSLGNQVADFVFQEDHYFENVGAISFFAASALFFACFLLDIKKLSSANKLSIVKPLIFLGLALMFFFAGGEEISWGQRIFGIQPSEDVLALNQQGEVTVHNLKVFEEAKFSFETAFDVFWLSFVLLLPLFVLFRRRPLQQFIPVPHLGIGLLFLFNYLWAKVAKLIYASTYTFEIVPFVQAVQEIKESNYSLFFAFVALQLMLQLLGFRAGKSTSAHEVQAVSVDEPRKI